MRQLLVGGELTTLGVQMYTLVYTRPQVQATPVQLTVLHSIEEKTLNEYRIMDREARIANNISEIENIKTEIER